MMIAQQKIIELKEKINIGLKVSRFLLLTTLISLAVNSVLAVQLYKTSIEANRPDPIYIGTGIVEDLGNNMFHIIEDTDLEK